MSSSPRAYSALYNRLLAARRSIPFAASLVVLGFELSEHGVPFSHFELITAIELLLFGLIGPTLLFLALTWLADRVAERDRAERDLALAIAHRQELLGTFERIVRTERLGFAPMIEQLLAAVCESNAVTAGAVYLHPDGKGENPTPVASWPNPQANALLDVATRDLAGTRPAALAESSGLREVLPVNGGSRVLTAAVTGGGETVGLLALALPADVKLPDSQILSIITSLMALVIRNGQLYARLHSQAALEERNELARDVHDTLAQSMGFLSLKAQHAQRLLDRGLLREASTALDELTNGSRRCYDEVRQMIQELRSPAPAADGLAHCVHEYAATMAARTGLEIAVDAPAEPSLSSDARVQLFRVVQEALNNVERHAGACHVMIRLLQAADSVTLFVQDDGVGLPSAGEGHVEWPGAAFAASVPSAGGEHMGLRMMAERVRSIGGQLQLESRRGNGTLLRVCVPASAAPALAQGDVWTASAS